MYRLVKVTGLCANLNIAVAKQVKDAFYHQQGDDHKNNPRLVNIVGRVARKGTKDKPQGRAARHPTAWPTLQRN